ncbi:MAG TPA: hypothetical protein VHJ34_05120 [Actinomycetota bacterium]|nr:hypothetical protein [Actinomycetota bacterium]
MRARAGAAALAAAALAPFAGLVAARAAPACGRAVVVTLPGVTWADVRAAGATEVLEVASEGALGSMSVRTTRARTGYPSAFASIGAGARIDGALVAIGPDPSPEGSGVPRGTAGELPPAAVLEVDDVRDRARAGGYDAVPGALAGALDTPVFAIGIARRADARLRDPAFVALAAMEPDGSVAGASIAPARDGRGERAAVEAALDAPCATTIVAPGALAAVDGPAASAAERARALAAADDLVGTVHEELDPARDLLLVVTPTTPRRVDDVHLGVAIAWGRGFGAGTVLRSASTRVAGIVTLQDVAPTVVAHHEAHRPAAMIGRAFDAAPGGDDRVGAAIALDRESVFAYGIQPEVIVAYVVAQIALYVAVAVVVRRSTSARAASVASAAMVAVLVFPLASYVVGALDGHALGTAGYAGALIAADAALTAGIAAALRAPLDRALAATLATVAVVVIDLVLPTDLQLNAVFGNLPVLGARFSGIGNPAFAVLGTSAVVAGAAIVQRWGAGARPLVAAGALFAVVVVADGAPQLGSDVGGVIALVPALGVTFALLSGRRAGWRVVAWTLAGAVLALAVFLVLDVTGSPQFRTHLGRLFEAVRDRGPGVFVETVARKLRTNVGVFRVTFWTFFVPPVVVALAVALLRWDELGRRLPALRAGFVGALLVAVLGGAVNDSGIVIPAMCLGVLVPAALLARLELADEARAAAVAPARGDARPEEAPA